MRSVWAQLVMSSLVLTACAESTVGQGSPEPSSASTSAVADATASANAMATRSVDPCAGVAGCMAVANVDVDGDGVSDSVGIAVTREAPPPQVVFGKTTITVRVGHAGRVATRAIASPGALPGSGSPKDVYVGAYRISRTAGADLVLHTQLGQGSPEQFVVVGWDAAGLTAVPAPPTGTSVTNPKPDVWLFASSHGAHDTASCANGANVTVQRLSAATVEGTPVPGGGLRESNHFAFVDGQWNPTGSENVPDSSFSYSFDPHRQTFDCADQGK